MGMNSYGLIIPESDFSVATSAATERCTRASPEHAGSWATGLLRHLVFPCMPSMVCIVDVVVLDTQAAVVFHPSSSGGTCQ